MPCEDVKPDGRIFAESLILACVNSQSNIHSKERSGSKCEKGSRNKSKTSKKEVGIIAGTV
jgi:hypothetical protein